MRSVGCGPSRDACGLPLPPGPRQERTGPPSADLTDYGQAVDALQGVDAVVHPANIPAPGLFTPAHTLNTNTVMNNNVFLAAAHHNVSRVVWASSETCLGLPFDVPPRYAPVDEAHYPYPTSTYALSKVAGETTARQIAEWSGMPFVALRLSNVHLEEDYRDVPGYWDDPQMRKWNLWGYGTRAMWRRLAGSRSPRR